LNVVFSIGNIISSGDTLSLQEKNYLDTNFSYQIKWLLIVTKITTKLDFCC